MQVLVYGRRVREGQDGKTTRFFAAFGRRSQLGAVVITVAAALILGGAAWTSPAAAVAPNPESPQPQVASAYQGTPILRRAEAARHHIAASRRGIAASRKRSRRARDLANVVGHGARPVKRPPRREPPRQRPIDHVHLAQSHGVTFLAMPMEKLRGLANLERGPPACTSPPGFTAVPAFQALDVFAADPLGAQSVGRRAIPSPFELNWINEGATIPPAREARRERRLESPEPRACRGQSQHRLRTATPVRSFG